jgi:hypothetical protein
VKRYIRKLGFSDCAQLESDGYTRARLRVIQRFGIILEDILGGDHSEQKMQVTLFQGEIVTAASIKMTLFRDVDPCCPVGVYRRCRCLIFHHIVLMMEATTSSETSVNSYQTTHNILEDRRLQRFFRFSTISER